MIPAMINTLKLDLERKKKSEERTFLGSCDSPSSSSSSGDEQLANDEENERARQKGGEESDGRRPMAEQERKVSDGNNEELLLPWKVEVCDPYLLVTNENLRRDKKLFTYSSWLGSRRDPTTNADRRNIGIRTIYRWRGKKVPWETNFG